MYCVKGRKEIKTKHISVAEDQSGKTEDISAVGDQLKNRTYLRRRRSVQKTEHISAAGDQLKKPKICPP